MHKEITVADCLSDRKNNFDFIRVVAAILVLTSHAYPLTSTDGEFLLRITSSQYSLGNVAVAIFFVVSGFLITQSYERSPNIISFLAARILRIFPGLIVAALFCSTIVGTIVSTIPAKEYLLHQGTYEYLKVILLFPMHWTLPGVFEHSSLNNSVNGSLWTIPFEVLCYLFVAVIGILGLIKYRKVTLLVFALAIYSMYYLKSFVPEDLSWVYLPSLFDLFPYFAAGMFVYSYRDKIGLNKWYALISVAMILLSAKFGGLNLSFILFGTYLIFYLAYNKRVKFNNFSKYGDLSYGIYVYAFPVQQSVTYLLGGKVSVILNIVISLPITIILAYLSWHIVEKRFLQYKKMFLFKNSKKTILHNRTIISSEEG